MFQTACEGYWISRNPGCTLIKLHISSAYIACICSVKLHVVDMCYGNSHEINQNFIPLMENYSVSFAIRTIRNMCWSQIDAFHINYALINTHLNATDTIRETTHNNTHTKNDRIQHIVIGKYLFWIGTNFDRWILRLVCRIAIIIFI